MNESFKCNTHTNTLYSDKDAKVITSSDSPLGYLDMMRSSTSFTNCILSASSSSSLSTTLSTQPDVEEVAGWLLLRLLRTQHQRTGRNARHATLGNFHWILSNDLQSPCVRRRHHTSQQHPRLHCPSFKVIQGRHKEDNLLHHTSTSL